MKTVQNYLYGLNTIVGIPTYKLRNIVDSFFEIKGKPLYKTHRILPRGTSEILFNFGDNIRGSSVLHDNITCKHYLCSGVRTAYFDSTPAGFINIVGIRFTIGGWDKLFRVPPDEMKNEDQNLEFILPKKEAETLLEKLFYSKNSIGRFLLLEKWITKKLSDQALPIKTEISDLILQNPFYSLKEIEKYSGYSRQYLHRIFKSKTGLSPKEYQQIRRFSKAIEIIERSKLKWTDIVYEMNYFDQSHFVKSFKKFSGFSPAEYLKQKTNSQCDPLIF
jgi:AraC-like DNA-binding protein